MYVNYSGGNQLAVGYISVTIKLVTFIGILVFQLANVTGITQCLKKKYTDMKSYITQTDIQVKLKQKLSLSVILTLFLTASLTQTSMNDYHTLHRNTELLSP